MTTPIHRKCLLSSDINLGCEDSFPNDPLYAIFLYCMEPKEIFAISLTCRRWDRLASLTINLQPDGWINKLISAGKVKDAAFYFLKSIPLNSSNRLFSMETAQSQLPAIHGSTTARAGHKIILLFASTNGDNNQIINQLYSYLKLHTTDFQKALETYFTGLMAKGRSISSEVNNEHRITLLNNSFNETLQKLNKLWNLACKDRNKEAACAIASLMYIWHRVSENLDDFDKIQQEMYVKNCELMRQHYPLEVNFPFILLALDLNESLDFYETAKAETMIAEPFACWLTLRFITFHRSAYPVTLFLDTLIVNRLFSGIELERQKLYDNFDSIPQFQLNHLAILLGICFEKAYLNNYRPVINDLIKIFKDKFSHQQLDNYFGISFWVTMLIKLTNYHYPIERMERLIKDLPIQITIQFAIDYRNDENHDLCANFNHPAKKLIVEDFKIPNSMPEYDIDSIKNFIFKFAIENFYFFNKNSNIIEVLQSLVLIRNIRKLIEQGFGDSSSLLILDEVTLTLEDSIENFKLTVDYPALKQQFSQNENLNGKYLSAIPIAHDYFIIAKGNNDLQKMAFWGGLSLSQESLERQVKEVAERNCWRSLPEIDPKYCLDNDYGSDYATSDEDVDYATSDEDVDYATSDEDGDGATSDEDGDGAQDA